MATTAKFTASFAGNASPKTGKWTAPATGEVTIAPDGLECTATAVKVGSGDITFTPDDKSVDPVTVAVTVAAAPTANVSPASANLELP